jgi:hypothetical protein
MSSAGDAVAAVELTGAEVYLGHTRFTAPDMLRSTAAGCTSARR